MNITLIPINKEISEAEFPEEAKNHGWNTIIFKYENFLDVEKVLRNFNEDLSLSVSPNQIVQKGMPDFFIWNDKEFFFCEFKSINDTWVNRQMNWVMDYPHLPYALAFIRRSNIK